MRYDCECVACCGTGEITCPECEGSGLIDGGIQSMKIDPAHPKYKELRALRNDAARAEDNAYRLIQMKPEHSESYNSQLNAALEIIEAEWVKVIKKGDEE